MHFTIAAATGFHLMAAMTAHGASRALSGFRGQGQGEVEDAEKSEQDERNYFFVAPLHYLEVGDRESFIMIHESRGICIAYTDYNHSGQLTGIVHGCAAGQRPLSHG
jgi:hypothetical protein